MIWDAPTAAGLLGAALLLTAYFATQQRWLSAGDWRFPLANLVGSCLILVSLATQWNWPAGVIEAAWAAISLMGLVRSLRAR
ncbi:MAG TPA: hypothetical protein VJR47_08960 [Stellaceae bacterium]|nr:hypothetical protein [Stellaceae bacterium]